MNDQPLNDGELDAKIRSLVASAVADTPAARPLPARDDAVVREMKKSPRRRGFALAGLGIAASLFAAAVVWSNHDDDPRVVPATTVSAPTTEAPPTTVPATTVPSWSFPWPYELAVIIASERGIERVTAGARRATAEHGMSVVTRLDEPLVGEVAFETVDGRIVSGENLMDVAIIDERLDATPISSDFQSVELRGLDGSDIQSLQGDFVHQIPRLTHGLDIFVGQSLDPDGGYRPLILNAGGQGNDDRFWRDLGVLGPFDTSSDSPRLFSVSPTGSTIGWVDGDRFVLADGRSFKIPPGSKIIEVDLADKFVALTRTESNAQIIDLTTGDAFPVPAAGRVTISLAPVVVPSPPDATTPVVTPEPIDVSSTVVTAGPDGVWRVVDGVATQLTAEPMSMSLQLPDGSVIMQRSSGWSSEGAVQADTTLLIWRSGQLDELFPGEVLGGWVRLHDVAMVNGEMTVLYAIEQEAQPFSVLVEAVLLARSLETWEITVVDAEFGGWEQGYSRMHLAETGLIVGEFYQEASRSLVTFGIAGATPLDAATLGLGGSYSQCSDCPRLYTVRRDGNIVAWLDGTTLHLATPGLTAAEQFDLGAAALEATDLELGNGIVVLSFGWNDPGAAAPVVIDFNIGAASAIELPGVKAAIVTVPTAPWEIDPNLTAALPRQSFGSQDELYAAVEEQIEAIRYSAVEPVEPITFTRSVRPDGSLVIAAPNFDDSVPQTWYRIVLEAPDSLTIDHIESVAVCRNFTYSTPTHLCV